jgi:AraC-like DNA-binding protein
MTINTLLSELLEHGMEDCWNSSWNAEGSVETSSRIAVDVAAIRSYLDIPYAERITLKDLSQKFYVEESYLARSFKSAFGYTVNDYLTVVRINKVKELLRFGSDALVSTDEVDKGGTEGSGMENKSGSRVGRSLTIAEIAELTGFNSEHYLSTRFRRHWRAYLHLSI